MKELGIFLFLAGLVAILAPYLLPSNFHFVFLDWMNTWGPSAAWAIKGGITLLGLVLWLSARRQAA